MFHMGSGVVLTDNCLEKFVIFCVCFVVIFYYNELCLE